MGLMRIVSYGLTMNRGALSIKLQAYGWILKGAMFVLSIGLMYVKWKKPPETAASQLWVVLAGGFISAADNGFVLEVRPDTSQLIMNNQDEKNKNQRWVFESQRSLNNSQINHLELVESAYHQIQEQQNSVKFNQELVPGAAAFIAIQTWDEKCQIDGISADDPRYKEYFAEKTGAEVTHFLDEESENMATLKASALSLAINAYKQKHSLHE